METSWFDKGEHSSGAISARLSGDATLLRNLVGDSLALIVQNAATAIAGLAKFLSGFSADAKKSYKDASQVAGDAVGSTRTIASFSAEEKVMQLYQMKCEGPMKAGIRQGLVCGVGIGFAMFSLFLVHAASFYAGARLVEAGKMDFCSFLSKAFYNLLYQVFFGLTMTTLSISQPAALALDLSRAKSAAASVPAASVLAILDQKSKIDSSDDSGTTLESVWGDIEFQHVSFNYATRPNIQIFRDLCLTISSSKTVALVGESGCGKSTVISLLQRFYDPNSDEATSALDAESEKVVLDALDRVMVDRTTVVVAHRLSTIIDADLIVVVKNGVIAEKGKHDTLMNINNGIYASLVALHISASP
ncbi:hypothetical protein ACSBR2_041562 [Camellia fascicularis]